MDGENPFQARLQTDRRALGKSLSCIQAHFLLYFLFLLFWVSWECSEVLTGPHSVPGFEATLEGHSKLLCITLVLPLKPWVYFHPNFIIDVIARITETVKGKRTPNY